MIKYSDIKNKLKINPLKDHNNQAALITHLLHSDDTSYNGFLLSQLSELEIGQFQEIDFDIPFPPIKKPLFKFIDLFAGIGGFRIAMQNLKGKCVFSSEIDRYARKSYELNFAEVPFGDITKIDEKKIPDHDILCAGFPCQAFSIAGKRKGFNETRGTLFFDIARILSEKRPKAFLLENVKGLRNHDRGKTIEVILDVLRNDLEYYVPEPKILNAKDYGLAQNRERIFIVGFRKDLKLESFNYPKAVDYQKTFSDIKEEQEVSVKYYLSDTYQNTLIQHKERHKEKGNGFGFQIIADDDQANAIVVGGMGRERNIVIDCRLSDFTPVTAIKGEVNKDYWRRMTPREWARLQGFPDSFKIEVSDAQAFKQFGNSVAVPVIQAIGKKIIDKLNIL
jgi:DNA (cytosine-5)-methyltransferase 1